MSEYSYILAIKLSRSRNRLLCESAGDKQRTSYYNRMQRVGHSWRVRCKPTVYVKGDLVHSWVVDTRHFGPPNWRLNMSMLLRLKTSLHLLVTTASWGIGVEACVCNHRTIVKRASLPAFYCMWWGVLMGFRLYTAVVALMSAGFSPCLSRAFPSSKLSRQNFLFEVLAGLAFLALTFHRRGTLY